MSLLACSDRFVIYSESPGMTAITPGSAGFLSGLIPRTGSALLLVQLERIFDFTRSKQRVLQCGEDYEDGDLVGLWFGVHLGTPEHFPGTAWKG
jgi:hypothetical protein